MRRFLGKLARRFFSERTLLSLRFDWLRFRARLGFRRRRDRTPPSEKLHLGCGPRRIGGWLNVDVRNSDFDVDLARTPLPWKDECFQAVVLQQVIEHLEVHGELLPLLRDLLRMMRPGAEIWLCCPDMQKVCEGYVQDRGKNLYEDAGHRGGIVLPDGMPVQHYINDIFHQDGSHKNLFDFGLLDWVLASAGFVGRERVAEPDLLERFPKFPHRGDDAQAIYVRALKRAG